MAKVNKSEKVPDDMKDIYSAVISLTDTLCKKHLNDEYAQLARYATASLCRKRPSPLMNGKINTWACGIVYALGFVNFLFDKSQKPYMNADDLCSNFGVSKSTGSAKSKVVRDILGMSQLDPNWCLPSKLDDNPMAWTIMVNGLLVNAKHLPREIGVDHNFGHRHLRSLPKRISRSYRQIHMFYQPFEHILWFISKKSFCRCCSI